MPDKVVLLALPGASHAGVGIWVDGRISLQEQVRQAFAQTDKRGMDSGFKVLSLDGLPVQMADGTLLPVNGAIRDGEAYAFVWIPSFLAENDGQLTLGLSRGRALHAWLQHQNTRGAILGASGAASLLLMEAGITREMPIPLSVPLRIRAQKIFPKLRFADQPGVADRGDVILSSGPAHDVIAVTRGMQRALTDKAGEILAYYYGLADEKRPDGVNPRMERARLLLEQTFASKFSIQLVASQLSISRSTFTRQFQRAFGVSPKAYLQNLRLGAARSMLEHTSRKIDDIAENVGYSDSRLFRIMFRKATGCSARQWRANFLQRRSK